MKNSSKYHVIGLMSGTSLDGLDMAYCTFELTNGQWQYRCSAANTIPYPNVLLEKLKIATSMSGEALMLLDVELGQWYGECVLDFIKEHSLNADFIASHGHTIFHQPKRKFTLQIGSGAQLKAITGLPVVNNFRAMDVALGGQGAPLVPIGDRLLFSEYSMCLNLGGITNISFIEDSKSVAFDIAPCNMVLNHLANKAGYNYDDDGKLAQQGEVNKELLKALNQWKYYEKSHPKSLGYEDVRDHIFPVIDKEEYPIEDALATFCEHLAQQIASSTTGHKGKLLATGGGAFNSYLIDRIRHYLPDVVDLIIPENNLISYKEAIVFGFLGVLRMRNEVNCLSSVTGAISDSSSGVIYQ